MTVLASLRFRLSAGVAMIAVMAVFAALLAAYGAAETAQRIDQSVSARRWLDAFSVLSARVSDYAVVAVEASVAETAWPAGLARLQSRAGLVTEAFARLETALAGAVADSEGLGETEQIRRATRSLVLARMRAHFERLRVTVEKNQGMQNLRVALDGFATRFSPLLNEAISEIQRDRDAASDSVAALRHSMIQLALGTVLLVVGLVVAFHILLIRPLVARLDRVVDAAVEIGRGGFEIHLPDAGRDELGRLVGVVNAMAAQLRGRRDAVDRDRARLNETIEQRTAALSQANDRLSMIDKERRRFFADIGHELRTPLTVILAETELALKDGIDPREAVAALSVIRSRALRLNRRIGDLLRVARSETGQVELDFCLFDLAGAVAMATADTTTMAARKNVTLSTDLQVVLVIGDADWLRQVVSGLLDNAVRHSPSGGVIDLATRPDGETVLLTVTDQGDGLAADECEAVFNRFARGGREASGPGFGVGLSLARWVIGQHDGDITLISPAPRPRHGKAGGGRGAQVVVRLPRHGSADEQRRQEGYG